MQYTVNLKKSKLKYCIRFSFLEKFVVFYVIVCQQLQKSKTYN